MWKKIKQFSILILISCIGIPVVGQQFTSTPFSRYSIGELMPSGYSQNTALGGIGTGLRDGFHINPENPASYTSVFPQSFLFEVGMSVKTGNFATQNDKQKFGNASFRHLAAAFPFARWWKAGFGISPYSTAGYNLTYPTSLEGDTIENTVSASGGASRLYFSNAFSLGKHLSVGADISYLIGLIDRSNESFLSFGNGYSKLTSTERIRFKDYYYKLGAQYTFQVKNNSVTLGVTYAPAQSVTVGHGQITTQNIGVNSQYFTDTLSEKGEGWSSVEIPELIGTGITFRKGNSLLVGFDYEYQDWTNSLFLDQAVTYYTKRQIFEAGLEYIPEIGAKSYAKNLRYRLGARTENSYITFDGNPIRRISAVAGIGIPFPYSKNLLNLSVEFGKNGNAAKNLLSENYVLFSLSYNFNDTWFIKRKYD